MSTKKKLVISLTVATAVLLIAVLTIVAVFAAANQAVSSNIRVKFRTNDVACKVVGTWAKKDASADTDSGILGSITIAARDEEKVWELSTDDLVITLSQEQNYVDFIYEFTNLGAKPFVVTLGQAITETESPVDAVFLHGSNEITADELINTGVTVAKMQAEGSVQTITVRIEIPDRSLGNDIQYTSDVVWNLDVVPSHNS